jgi:hypothetical protein
MRGTSLGGGLYDNMRTDEDFEEGLFAPYVAKYVKSRSASAGAREGSAVVPTVVLVNETADDGRPR